MSVDYLELDKTPGWLKREFEFMGSGGKGGGTRISGVEGKLSQAGLNRINSALGGVDKRGRTSGPAARDAIAKSRNYKGKKKDLAALDKSIKASKSRSRKRAKAAR